MSATLQENPVLKGVLDAIKPTADALMAGEIAQVPKLSDEGLVMLETVVAPKLDIPPLVISVLKGENAAIEKVVDPMIVADLQLLVARVDALL